MSKGGEKQFAPTAKRLRDAAQKGDVLRSRDLAGAATLLTGLGLLALAGPWLAGQLAELLRSALTFDRAMVDAGPAASGYSWRIAGIMVPVGLFGLTLTAISFASQLGFGDGRWVGANMGFKAGRLNPLSGLKRVFGTHGLIEMGKGLAKLIVLGAIACTWGRSWVGDLVALGAADLATQIALSWGALLSLGFALCGGLLVIAVLDGFVQFWRRLARLRMTQEEMRQEHKEAEGSPEARAHRRQRQRDIAMGSVAPAMREAQFVVTNPTHFAVALAYDPARAPAPVVLAKGRGEKALAMRELAAERTLPVLEYPALARSLYYSGREREMIREELYGAVAALVAFVLALGRGETPPFPRLSVPVQMRFDAEGRREG